MRWSLLVNRWTKPVNSSTDPLLHALNALNVFHLAHEIAIGVDQRVIAIADDAASGETVKYLPPFELIRRSIEISTVRGELRVNISYENFVAILQTLIRGVEVDEAWYARTYEDIGRAIKEGSIRSAKQHFIDDGYFEGRLPFPINIDERWYLEEHPDVAESIRNGVIDTAQDHFAKDGYREGRLPFGL